jgi:drug/metabolite transporter (DMT)-like permease
MAEPKRMMAFAALVAAMVIWGSTFVVTKVTMQEFPPVTLAFLRFAIASLFLLAFVGGWRRAVHLRQRVSLWRLALLAATGFVFFTVALNYALVAGSAAQGAVIYALTPAVVAISAALFLRERLRRRRILGVVLSIGGAVAVALGGQQSLESAPAPILGAILMLWTVLLWGAYTVAAKQVADVDPLLLTFAMSGISALLLLPASAAELAMLGLAGVSSSGWLGALYLGIAASAACYALYHFALRELDASTVGVYTNIDPVVGVATAFLFLGERLSPAQAVGAAVVFAGMWLASTDEPRG